MRSTWAFATVSVLAVLGHAEASPGSVEDRTLDFSGGLSLGPAHPDVACCLAGVRLQLRWLPPYRWLHVGALAAYELGADDRNPERLRRLDAVALGAIGGVHHDFLAPLTLALDGRLEWLNLWHYPNGERSEGVHNGVRAGPEAAVTAWLGRAWGHGLAVELRIAYLVSTVPVFGESTWRGWQLGVAFGGVLSPEPSGAR
jgi:hypothetical protein